MILRFACDFSSKYSPKVISVHSRLKSHVSRSHNLKDVLLSMSKEQKTESLLKTRSKMKEKGQKYVPGTVALQVLGSGARGTPRSLYVFTDQSRYMFNCGEGTQRLAHEHKMKLSKLEHIFVTHSSWENIGGLPGIALTIQDVGVPEITLHGPPGLDEIFSATERFIKLKDLKIHMAECNEVTNFDDAVFTVKYVPVISKTLPEEQANSLEDLSPSLTHDNNERETANSTRRGSPNSRQDNGSVTQQMSESGSDDDVDYYEHERTQKRKRVQETQQTKRKRLDPKLFPPKTLNIAMSYICKLKDRPGTLSLERCVDRKVPAGPLLGRLKSGENVTLPDGTVVRSADVRDPDDPGPLFVVVDCPSEDYVESLVENVAFKKHQASAEKDSELARLVVHFTPPSVMSHPRYFAWMEAFSSSTQHLVLNESNRCMGSLAIHRAQYLLNSLSRESTIFPLLKDDGIKMAGHRKEETSNQGSTCDPKEADHKNSAADSHVDTVPCSDPVTLEALSRMSSYYERRDYCNRGEPNIFILERGPEDSNISASGKELPPETKSHQNTNYFPVTGGQTLLKYHLRPLKGFDWKDELLLQPDEYDKEMNRDLLEQTRRELLAHFAQKKTSAQETSHTDGNKFPRVSFLGTGSCIPNKTRNTSGILLHISDQSYMILDCGEGTYGQLVRLKGWHQTNVILRNMKAIYVSHLHADHHIGLIALLKARRRALDLAGTPVAQRDKLFLLAPAQIAPWLRFYHHRFEHLLQEVELVANGKLDMSVHTMEPRLEQLLLSRLGLTDVSTCFVRHCPNAYGVSLKHSDWKITYSGDTMPCDALVALGEDSSLLIHEATMEDELEWEAQLKMHSTTSQAIEAGRRMRAKHVILTHFSQRYAKVPRLEVLGEGGGQDGNVGIAFDNMEVGLDDLEDLPVMIPALKMIFADHHDELEQKAYRRQMRKIREAASSTPHSPPLAESQAKS